MVLSASGMYDDCVFSVLTFEQKTELNLLIPNLSNKSWTMIRFKSHETLLFLKLKTLDECLRPD